MKSLMNIARFVFKPYCHLAVSAVHEPKAVSSTFVYLIYVKDYKMQTGVNLKTDRTH